MNGGGRSTWFLILGLVVALGLASMPLVAQADGTTVLVGKLEPSWSAPGGGGVYAAYYTGPYDTRTVVSPGPTALFDGREAGIIKAGYTDVEPWDEGLFAFKPAMTIDAFAAGPVSYDVENEAGVNPVWMTIEVDTGAVGDRNDNTSFQHLPPANPAGWHTVDAAAGAWYRWLDDDGNIDPTPWTLSGIAADPTYTGRDVVRAYLRLGMGLSYYNGGTHTIGWVDKVVIGAVTYDFVVMPTACTTDCYVDAAAGDDTLPGTPGFPKKTIQAAVTAVTGGGTVHVAAGTYTAGANLSKPVTLLGAQAGVDARDGRPGASETIISAGGLGTFPLNATDVTFDGFKFTNIKSRTIDTYFDADRFTMRNCILECPSIDPGYTTGAIQFGGGLSLHANGLLFEQNLVTADNGQLLYMGHAMDNGTVRNNLFNGDSVSFGPFGERTGWLIEGNEFDGNVGIHGPYWGFGFNANLGDVIIRNNYVHEMVVGIGQISVVGGSIIGNTFDDNSYAAFQLWGGEWGSVVSENVLIENNWVRYNGTTNTDFTDAAHGIRLRPGEGSVGPIDASTVHLHENRFEDLGIGSAVNAWAIRQQGTGTADAERNYWGTTDGGVIATMIGQGAADYEPWIASYTDDPTPLYPNGFWPIDLVLGPPCTTDCYVDAATGSDANPGTADLPFLTIQKGVDTVSAGGTVHVADGTYVEQVNIGKSLSLTGAGVGTVVKSPATLAPYTIGGAARRPIVYVHGATVTVQQLTVDGDGLGNANSGFMGIAYQNAAGTIDSVTITRVRNTPLDGAQHGVGLYVRNEDSTPRTLAVGSCVVNDFQKNATAFVGTGLTVSISGSTFTGAGPTAVTAQNGIQISGGAGGSVTGGAVSGIAYTGSGWVASGMLLQNGTTVSVEGASVSSCQACVLFQETDGSVASSSITAADVDYAAGVSIRDYGTEGSQKGGLAPLSASPYDEGGPLGGGEPDGTPTAVSIDGVTLTGASHAGSYGVAVWGMGDSASASVVNSPLISNWEIALLSYNAPSIATLTAHGNCIDNNTVGFYAGTVAEQDASANWWGDASGPFHSIKNPGGLGDEVTDLVDFEPWVTDGCGGSTTTGNWYNTTTGVYDDFQDSLDNALPGETVQAVGTSPLAGGGIANQPGVTIDLNGRIVGPGSPFLTVYADDITVIGPGTIDGGAGGGSGIVVNAGADNFILENTQVTGWDNGIELAGDITSFKVVGNWIHSNAQNGLLIDAGVDLAGIVTIEGNLFKVNTGNGIQHDGNGTLPAEYNSWGNIGGYGPGDGIGGLVDADPFTYVESFFDVWPDGLVLERHVPEEISFDVALKADAVNVYGLTFKFTYDTARLELNSTTFAGPWAAGGRCAPWPNPNPDGVVSYVCQLYAGDAEWNAVAGTIATFSFTALTLPSDAPLTTDLDISHIELDTSAGAIGGQKIFMNNAGFNLPSAAERDITDTNDGRIIVERLANYTGFIDLQGRTNDSGALFEVHATSAYGSTLLAQATSASSGAYTTAHVLPYWLGIGNTYWFQVNRTLYLPTTALVSVPPAPPGPYVHSKELTAALTALAKVTLLGGDATDDEGIQVGDLSCIGGNYGGSGVVCGATGWSDVNGDGKVNVQDLSMAGGNLYKTSSPWTP